MIVAGIWISASVAVVLIVRTKLAPGLIDLLYRRRRFYPSARLKLRLTAISAQSFRKSSKRGSVFICPYSIMSYSWSGIEFDRKVVCPISIRLHILSDRDNG